MSEHLTTTQRGSTTIVTIDDGKANALSGALITGLTDTIDKAVSDGSTAVVIAGRPGVFSGGFDLGVMRSGDAAAEPGSLDFSLPLVGIGILVVVLLHQKPFTVTIGLAIDGDSSRGEPVPAPVLP